MSSLRQSLLTNLARIMAPELPLSNKTLILCKLLFPNQVSMNAVVIGQRW